jgi:hypothetical protein
MQRFLGFAVAVSLVIGLASSVHAINIVVAEVQNGVAVVRGNQAARNAAITWETANVTKANNGGAFSFSGVVPNDCVGTLSDGVSTIEVAVLDCTPVSVAPARVPRTGVTTSLAAGDDGALQKGIPLPTPRFTDNNNGTITDNLTGLIWLKNANCIASSYPGFDQTGIIGDGAVTWFQAMDFVAGINSGTYNCGDISGTGNTHRTDWRLPNIRELSSLVNYAFFTPAISNAAGTGHGNDSDPFSNLSISGDYLSSTTMARVRGVFRLDFEDGILFEGSPSGPQLGFVLAVRGGS